MDLHLAGRKVLVTGATRGIGKATALAYAREGADVAITWSNDASAAQEVASMVVQVGHKLSRAGSTSKTSPPSREPWR